MEYVIAFLEKFINNVFGSASTVGNSSMSTLPTTTALSATATTVEGFDQENPLLATTFVGVGTSVSAAIPTAKEVTDSDIHIAQAYMESMDEYELNEFINKLENVEIKEKPKTLQKTYNKNI